jgi:hypothetical protein
MRKKGRNGPGMRTLADSDDPPLAADGDEKSGGAAHRTAGAKYEPMEKVAAIMATRRKRDLAHRFACEAVRRSVRTFKSFLLKPEASL